MTDFIEEHLGVFGVEPICRVLPIAPSTYHQRALEARKPERASARSRTDAALRIEIARVWEENRQLYGARKIWHALRREGHDVARCTVERLMKSMGIKGVVRGRKIVTTNPDTARPCPDDKVNRQFKAERPNQLWVSDFTYVPTWSGTVYVAFVIDVFARRIVGWRVSTSMSTQFVLDVFRDIALEGSATSQMTSWGKRRSGVARPPLPPTRARVLPVLLAATAVRVVRSSTIRKRIGCPADPSTTNSTGFT